MKRLLLISTLALSCAALRPSKGDTCQPGAAACEADGSSIQCVDGHFASFPCPGPLSCSMGDAHKIYCDQTSGVEPGQACPMAESGKAECNGNKTSALKCKGGTWVAAVCAGGCDVVDGMVQCK